MSLRSRLFRPSGWWPIAALVAADVATYSALRSFLLDRVDQGLQSSHVEIEQCLTPTAVSRASGPGRRPAGHGSAPYPGLDPGTFLEVRYPSGQPYVQDAYQFSRATHAAVRPNCRRPSVDIRKRGPGWRTRPSISPPPPPEGRSRSFGCELSELLQR